MSEDILDKIKFLCRAIPMVEWSGILFYSIQGTIKKPEEMKMILQDILPMDKGTKAYTEYEIDNRYVDYLMEEGQEHRMEWKMGHIHSHNSMAVFFSGTDVAELHENSEAHNFYLSLIVNNYMDFCARVAYRGKAETITESVPYHALDENGEAYIIDEGKFTITKEKLYWHNCDIQSPEHSVEVDVNFAKKVEGIIKDAEVKAKNAQQKWQQNKSNLPSKTNNLPSNPPVYDGFPQAGVDDDFVVISTDIEVLGITLLRGTNPPDENIRTIEDAIEELELIELSPEMVTNSIADNYVAVFNSLYENNEDKQLFADVTTELIDLFEQKEHLTNLLSGPIMWLKNMLAKFDIENGTAV